MAISKIKRTFADVFQVQDHFESQHVRFRPYNPSKDSIFESFSPSDWDLMFPNTNKETFNKWSQLDHYVILSCFDRFTNLLVGVLVFTNTKNPDNGIYFHGGTLKKGVRFSLMAYEGLHYVLKFLIEKGFEIYTSCVKVNISADMFQKRFGFIEFFADHGYSYKYLDFEKFSECDILQRINLCYDKLNHQPINDISYE